ncbi:hypothetical protein WT67_12170 [Burkholderia stagnalis]|uniref:DUF4438 domain-containing protein n=1 Tax=Burkholderia stagnalis TaxID=1503054 RepID=A0A6L3MLE4_9BURK|nr:DUF4438 domain-containing protein [Burkholderia stagnalis]AOK53013.1 hypothetical protein WT74_10095 [Burkholderia stagnalis]KAB0632104.1 DUF4438 domain-containing protein [Burkholderia stagnalis]KVN74284.1 hypothetical protein WT15_22850 [Burkholderia stagnalis]KVO37782.1 hypothetical protein WT17_23280 [Burkholderia stagnalis]KVO80821.1 hypothetical protein WT19_34050 [Burkholderia stagnalis]
MSRSLSIPRDGRTGPRINADQLVATTVAGQIAHPVGQASAYRIGYDGVARVLPGTGGIALNKRIGDLCVGLAGDHVEPGVALHNNGREVTGPRDGPNNALMTAACVGNVARVVSGPCCGKVGMVTGKHGGVNHVLVDFPTDVLMRLRIGDRVQIVSHGLGLRLPAWPRVEVLNCAPRLLRRWGILARDGRLHVPVTHLVPSRLMGSGLGKNTAWRGDYDIQLSDRPTRERYRLGSLRFGDMVAITDADTRRGPLYHSGRVTIGVIVHGDSTVSGHGPGVTPLLTGPADVLIPMHAPRANLAEIFGIRRAAVPRERPTLAEIDCRRRRVLREPPARLAFDAGGRAGMA